MGNLGNLTMDAMLAKPVASVLVGLFAALAGTVWWKTRYEKSTYSLHHKFLHHHFTDVCSTYACFSSVLFNAAEIQIGGYVCKCSAVHLLGLISARKRKPSMQFSNITLLNMKQTCSCTATSIVSHYFTHWLQSNLLHL